MCISTFGLGGLSVAVEVYRARANLCRKAQLTYNNVEAVEIFFMLMRDDFLLLFRKE